MQAAVTEASPSAVPRETVAAAVDRVAAAATVNNIRASSKSTSKAHVAVQVHAVRVGRAPDRLRLVLESEEPIHARVTHPSQPGPFIIDLGDVALNATLAALPQKVGANDPYLTSVRISRSESGLTRMKLISPIPVTPKIFNLKPGNGHGNRLVLDIYGDRFTAPPSPQPAEPEAPAAPQRTVAASARVAAAAPTAKESFLSKFAWKARAAIQVNAVRVGRTSDHIRLVLESNEPIRASVAPSTQPGLLLIDLADVALNAVLTELPKKVGTNDPYLTSVKISRGKSGLTRIELISPVSVTPHIFSLKPENGHGNRLVMDVYPDRFPAPLSPQPSGTDASVPAISEEAVEATAAPEHPAPKPSASPVLSSKADERALQDAWFEVHINKQIVGTALVLQDAAHHVLVREGDLEQWRIHVEGVAKVHRGKDTYYPLDAVKGLSYRIDEATQSLLLDVTTDSFDTTHLSGLSRGLLEPTPAPPGASLDYDVFVNRSQRGPMNGSVFIDADVFGGRSNGTSTMLARHWGGHNQVVRLDTVWTHDQPDKMASLRFGDALSGASSWGRSVRFGGVQWATDFATQPTFVTIPMPTLSGTATTPSTLDFYVNDALRLSRNVPSGPFSIQDIPVVTGQGQIRLVVRDLLGREQTVLQPFYASGGLLAQGLRDYSYEAGFERQNYALNSNDYGRFVAVGTERWGLSDTFTAESHAELLRDQQTLGMGGTWLLSTSGVLTASVAASHNSTGSGGLVSLGFQRQSGRFSFGARTQLTSPGFAQLGYQSQDLPPRQTTTAFMSLGTYSHGSMGMSYTQQSFRERSREDIELISANYNRSLGELGYLTFSVLRFLGDNADTLLGLNFTRPFGERGSTSFNAQSHGGSNQGTLQLQQNLPAGGGMGYHVQTGLAESDPRQAGISLQNDVGTYTFDAAENQSQLSYQASMRGSISTLGGKVFLSRKINDSFAVVRVPGYENVRVYADNQQVARTDSNGYALIPRLRPYQQNPIRIEQADLPLDARIDGLQVDAVPYLNGALALTFPVKRSHGALLTIKLGDGSFLPAGAEVAVPGNPNAFPVGMKGEVYLTGLTETNRLHVSWQGKSCDLVVHFLQTPDPLPHLGPLTCPEITR